MKVHLIPSAHLLHEDMPILLASYSQIEAMIKGDIELEFYVATPESRERMEIVRTGISIKVKPSNKELKDEGFSVRTYTSLEGEEA